MHNSIGDALRNSNIHTSIGDARKRLRVETIDFRKLYGILYGHFRIRKGQSVVSLLDHKL